MGLEDLKLEIREEPEEGGRKMSNTRRIITLIEVCSYAAWSSPYRH